MELTSAELALLEQSIREAAAARAAGNHPFGSVLGDAADHLVLSAQNTVVTESDVTGHAELNLVRLASRTYGRGELSAYTLYTSTEPCAMCAGGIYWAGIGRVVFALPEEALADFTGDDPENPTMDLPCRQVFAAGRNAPSVVGPVPLESARAVHTGFWRP